MYIFSKEYRKQVKKNMVDWLFEKYKEMKNDKYSDDLMVFCIKAGHMYHPITCLLIMWLAPYWFAMFTFLTIIGVLIMFVYLNGCFLSTLEYKINNLDVTIADPIIMLFGGDITYANRVWYSIATISIYLVFCVCLLAYRFYPFGSSSVAKTVGSTIASALPIPSPDIATDI